MRRLATVAAIATFLALSAAPLEAAANPDAKVEAKAPAKKAEVKVEGKVTVPASQPAAKKGEHPVPPPTDVKGAVDGAKDAYKAAKEGRWWYFSALVVTLLMFLLKFVGKKAGFWPKMGRWRYVLPPVLSIAAALLAAFQGGVSFDSALGVFTSSYATSSLQELWEHGILNKPRESSKPG
jgi:hypothetical protein